MTHHLRHWIRLVEAADVEPGTLQHDNPPASSPEPLPPDVIAAFQDLGDRQRGEPEMAMVRAQHVLGGGVLSSAIEHVGDIIHRMSHLARRRTAMGAEKIHKTLQWLTSQYGFEREMKENFASNARYRGIPLASYRKTAAEALRAYAHAHAALPVYNRAQWLAREAAVSLGDGHFDITRDCLRELAKMAPNADTFADHAFAYTKDANGHLQQYQAP